MPIRAQLGENEYCLIFEKTVNVSDVASVDLAALFEGARLAQPLDTPALLFSTNLTVHFADDCSVPSAKTISAIYQFIKAAINSLTSVKIEGLEQYPKHGFFRQQIEKVMPEQD